MRVYKLQIYIDRYGTEKIKVRAMLENSVQARRIYTPGIASRRRLEALTYNRNYRTTSIIGSRDFDLFIKRSK